jgi:hypothetical protein
MALVLCEDPHPFKAARDRAGWLTDGKRPKKDNGFLSFRSHNQATTEYGLCDDLRLVGSKDPARQGNYPDYELLFDFMCQSHEQAYGPKTTFWLQRYQSNARDRLTSVRDRWDV